MPATLAVTITLLGSAVEAFFCNKGQTTESLKTLNSRSDKSPSGRHYLLYQSVLPLLLESRIRWYVLGTDMLHYHEAYEDQERFPKMLTEMSVKLLPPCCSGIGEPALLSVHAFIGSKAI